MRLLALAVLALSLAGGVSAATSANGLPSYVNGYEKWKRVNAKPIPPRSSDPHYSVKNVYASKVRAGSRYPVGAILVKAGTRPGAKWVSLVATMRRVKGARNGGWLWEEFTRSGPAQRFTKVGFPESGCAACHAQAKASDYVFTRR